MKSRSAYPPGALNINGFSFFNAVSFQIVLGAPVILFAKSLGASSFLLGTIAALTPLLNILQLLAARFLHRTGYKRFVLAGWGARTFFTLCIAAVPVWPGLTISGRLWLLAGSLFGFNLLRGFSAGAWLPWLTALVPEQVRGSFLSRDNAFMHLGCLVALLVSAWVMSGSVEAAEYTAVFGIGLVAALISLWFVHRIPDAESPEDRLRSGVPVPWGAMLRHVPFARLLSFTTIYMTVIGSLGVFTVEYLVVREKFGEATILLLGSLSFVGALVGLAITAPRLDVTGSKPWLRRGLILMALVIFGWFALAAGLLPGWPGLVGGLNFLGGLAGAVFGVANTRIVMVSVPAMGRNHFFALFTVVCGLGLGGAPMAWGAVLDALGSLEVAAGPLSINRYSLYFAVLALLACWDVRLIPGLREGVSAGSVPLTAAEARPVAPVE
ncbi:MAG: MFS transporter [Chthoniobacterales bacterium]|nr:MFS transporter [Chthoniobacterales bacterium]